ncbi:TetR/AcrR family transcriptional regulator [Microbispora sp. NPDC049125]|uniref:TetR/AcrR family transcriptional regulator n=1 Tax=Microbispora sp. NPDC049125 TaxID=3154929 RepID=UPI003467706B
MDEQVPGRRARLRAQTTAEIKNVALKLMADGGADAISLRAIAREMGMSGSAIYSYFETRDALITTLINDVYTSLMDQVETARDACRPDDAANRILAWGQAVREWALANPQGFRLIYGDPVAGYQAPESGPAPEAAKRACLGLTGLVAAAWSHAQSLQAGSDHQWSDFAPTLVATVRDAFPDLPAAALALALRVWGRMQGLIVLEIYGHLGPQTREPAKLYHAEMIDLIRSLGLAQPE